MVDQYVIWGKAPGAEYEALLVSEYAGISSYAVAVEACYVLEHKHGCSELRAELLAPLGDAAEVSKMFGAAVG